MLRESVRVYLDFAFSLSSFSSLLLPMFDPSSHPAWLCTDALGIGRLETKEEGSRVKFKTQPQHKGNVMATRDDSTREAIVVPLSMK